MKNFEIGKTYFMTFIGDSNLIVNYTVIARTAKTITITDGRETKKCRISEGRSNFNGAETVLPYGQYSMCPSLHADFIL